jgi:putative transcriptional regulator
MPALRSISRADRKVGQLMSQKRMSQPIFAAIAAVGVSTVAQWEQGHKKPSRASERLLDVIDRKGIEAISAAA